MNFIEFHSINCAIEYSFIYQSFTDNNTVTSLQNYKYDHLRFGKTLNDDFLKRAGVRLCNTLLLKHRGKINRTLPRQNNVDNAVNKQTVPEDLNTSVTQFCVFVY